ncbi:MAG: hypothetical protein O2854_02335 [Chloroflexi bacterium]|nr:hypothetical protein [Chloroflexota bacterium]
MRVMHGKRVTQAVSLALLAVAALVITVVANFNTTPTAEAAIVRDVVVVGLGEMNSSGQSGVAVLSEEGTGTRVVISVTSGATGVAQPVHIHSGTCSTLGGVVHSLTSVTNGSSSTLVAASLSSLLTGGFAINLHKSAAEVSVYTACGNIPARASQATMEISSSTQAGYATISEVAGGRTQIAVSIKASAIPGRVQPINVRAGRNCVLPTSGSLEFALTNIVNGRSVTTLDVPYIAFRATEHLINVQKSTTDSGKAACGDLAKATLPSINKVVVVPMQDLNSGQSGVALLISRGATTEVVVSVTNVTDLPQPMHIHSGTCSVLGGVTNALNPIENGWSSTIVSASLVSLTTGGFAINIHKSNFEISTYMSCGEIPTSANSVTFRLAGTGKEAQVGYAGMVSSGDNTWVSVWVTPSSKGLAQPMHIHSGTCSSPGPILNPLNDLVDGRSTTQLVGVKMADLQVANRILNLHKSAAEISVYPACARLPVVETTSGGGTVAPVRNVSITSTAYPNVSVTRGTRVVWTNNDTAYYTITASGGSFDSGLLPRGFTYSRTFATAGTFTVTDVFSGKTATVTVQ